MHDDQVQLARIANLPEKVQHGVPFTGENLEKGMVVTVFDHAEITTVHCKQTIKAGAYESSDSTSVDHRCLERPAQVNGMGVPLTVLAVMQPYIVIQDDQGMRGTMDVRNRTFMLVTKEYRDACNAAQADAQEHQEQQQQHPAAQEFQLPPPVQAYMLQLKSQLEAQTNTCQFLLNFAVSSQIQVNQLQGHLNLTHAQLAEAKQHIVQIEQPSLKNKKRK